MRSIFVGEGDPFIPLEADERGEKRDLEVVTALAAMSDHSQSFGGSQPIYAGEHSADASPGLKKSRTSCLGWTSALGALLLLYAVFGLGFWGLLMLSEVIRGDDGNYKVLPKKYYGDYVYRSNPPIPIHLTSYPAGYDVPWNSTLFA